LFSNVSVVCLCFVVLASSLVDTFVCEDGAKEIPFSSQSCQKVVSFLSPMSAPNIYLYVPNIIGYFRAIFTVWALAIAPTDPTLCLVLYTSSFVLDAADGHAARLLDQCSSFGAVLDMVIDRASTSGFLVVLSSILGQKFVLPAALLIMLDLVSHFVRMHSSLTSGNKSHKDTDGMRFAFLAKYYGSKPFMCTLCVGQEAIYLVLYAQHFWAGAASPVVAGLTAWDMVLLVLFPLFAGKQWANVLQLADGMMTLADKDAEDRLKRSAKGK
jgi:CDP-diacylglycerol--inositol 3-phosphatidyltransferase